MLQYHQDQADHDECDALQVEGDRIIGSIVVNIPVSEDKQKDSKTQEENPTSQSPYSAKRHNLESPFLPYGLLPRGDTRTES
jgi:hypothetical protein